MAHHSFSQGRPAGHLFQTVSTEGIATASRFDFWAGDVMRTFSIERRNARPQDDFRAQATSLATLTGEMHYAQSDGFNASITRQTISTLPFDELALILMLDGQAHCAYDGDHASTINAGDFFLLDGSRPTSLSLSRHALIQLDLSRPLLTSLFPGALPSPALINQALSRSRLAALLRDHLRQFPRIAAGMAPLEQLALLDASEAFALATVKAAFSCVFDMAAAPQAGMFAAAQHYIRRHLSRPDLSPETIAAALGCSRATLYRLFARHELTVQGYVREMRLQQFRHLLQKEDDALPVQLLALRCGLYDWSNVSRMFRKRFGMSPGQARAASRP